MGTVTDVAEHHKKAAALALAGSGAHSPGMDTAAPEQETPAQREARIRLEARIIAQAEADIDAGLGIEEEAFEAWLDALDLDPDAPLPEPRSPASVGSRP